MIFQFEIIFPILFIVGKVLAFLSVKHVKETPMPNDDDDLSRPTPRSLPSYDVYLIADGLSPARQRWIKVGIAFVNRDASVNVILDALPLNGKLQLRSRDGERTKA